MSTLFLIPFDNSGDIVYSAATMRYLKLAIMNIPDQILSTFALWGGCFVWYRGFVSIFENPPSRDTLVGVILIGVVLGLMVARTQSKMPNEKHNEAPKTDR